MPSTLLKCPDCGGQQFSWVLEQIQFGSAHEFQGGRRDVEGMEMGEVVGADISENGVFCTECHGMFPLNGLHRIKEND